LAELSSYIQPTNENIPITVEECQEVTFNKLLQFMPSPPNKEGLSEEQEEPSLLLTHVECLMYTFHSLGKCNPEFMSKLNEDIMKEFKLKLQYLARGIQNYIKKLKESLSASKTHERAKEDHKLKFVALKTTTNINTLIRDLFHLKPSFKSTINLSWKPVVSKPASERLQSQSTSKEETLKTNKRKAITPPEDNKSRKEGRLIYAPPSGKFSFNFKGNYSSKLILS